MNNHKTLGSEHWFTDQILGNTKLPANVRAIFYKLAVRIEDILLERRRANGHA